MSRRGEYSVGKPHQSLPPGERRAQSQAPVSNAEKLRIERLEAERQGLSLVGQLFGDPPASRSALGRKLEAGE